MSAEKKKLLIIGLLAFIVLCVGVFQFTGGGKKDAAVPPRAKKSRTLPAAQPAGNTEALNNAFGHPPTSAATNVLNPNDKNAVAAAVPAEPDLPVRDPFNGEKYLPADATPKPTPAPTPPAPSKLVGKIKPVEPMGANSSLPPLGSNVNLSSLSAKPKDVFEYSVSGVVTGDRPAAVFQDSKGNQRLIQLGGSLDGDTKVVSISRGKVTVAHHGKNMTLTVGADNPTEKRSDEK